MLVSGLADISFPEADFGYSEVSKNSFSEQLAQVTVKPMALAIYYLIINEVNTVIVLV